MNTLLKELIEGVEMRYSRPSAYGEYEPYRFVDSEVDFENAVLSMVS